MLHQTNWGFNRLLTVTRRISLIALFLMPLLEIDVRIFDGVFYACIEPLRFSVVGCTNRISVGINDRID
jgi:hypothetical protein